MRKLILALGLTSLATTARAASAATPEALYDRITWIFQCPSSPITVPTAGPNELVLVDAGPHHLLKERAVGVPVTVHGKVCPTQRVARDVIFVVDVSSSMAGNDPMVPDPNDPTQMTCGRYEAYKAVMAGLPLGISEIAVVTFGDMVERFSTGFFDTQAGLEADLTASGTAIRDVFCENPGGTMYVPAFEKAVELFLSSRPTANKEVYFLTDGQPGDSDDSKLKADEMKAGVPVTGSATNIPVTIAAVMLGQSDQTLLHDFIASKDTDGSPLFANAANASELARILARLTDNGTTGTKLTQGGDNAPTPIVTDLMPLLDPNTFEFTVPPSPLQIDLGQTEYVMKFEYWNAQSQTFTADGRIIWLDH